MVRTNPFQRSVIEGRGEEITLPDASTIKAWIRDRTEVDNDAGSNALLRTYTLWVDTPSKGTLAANTVIHGAGRPATGPMPSPARSYWVQSVYDLEDGLTQGILTIHD